ncbi:MULTISPECIES: NADH:flavin oxidoreductase [unclassified Massilia]|uniref:NADH:flavin oxidoreductase n=1 Tax=unclassified Massilia TaxID=2609279 RepID=UPI001B845DFC|nr:MULTISPECIES: NADH:flavin oxidoreductase [unclassified Massilia]MBQ5941467.1 NADH:flavin oxidoreductase [Massilia sp. AB1]MBQ5964058.1 NADH:flavin oxidoreductase [Massilia sp. ZL223]
MGAPHQHLFDPLAIGPMLLPNRVVVAPMTRVSATEQGRATEEMQRYYRSFAEGGFGLVITEGIYTDKAYSQGYLRQPGLADSAQCDAWRPIVRDVHASGARMVAQLMHAGALSQGNPYRSGTRGPSAVRPKGEQMSFYRGAGPYALPQAMSGDEIVEAIRGFADAAARAREAGFDGVEIHAANGYLLDQFLSEAINLREDRYGGMLERRLLLIVEVVEAVRHVVGPGFAVGIRISQAKVNDFAYTWSGAESDAALVFGTLRKLPLDYLHTTEFEAWKPAFGTGPSLAALAKRYAGLPLIANGSLHDPERAAALVGSGEADAVSLGRGALTHADWPRRVRKGEPIDDFDRAILSPLADLANAAARR